MSNKKIRIVLVDDELRALNRLNILLSNFEEVEVIAQYEQPEQAVKGILNLEPDLILLDIEMARTSGLEIAQEINRHNVETRIIFITAFDHYAIKAIKVQAFDYLLKPVSIDELKSTLGRYRGQLHSNLSKRELEIIRLLAKGDNSRTIGEKLFISRHTVDTYRRKILEKTGCKNSAELIKYASENKLV